MSLLLPAEGGMPYAGWVSEEDKGKATATRQKNVLYLTEVGKANHKLSRSERPSPTTLGAGQEINTPNLDE